MQNDKAAGERRVEADSGMADPVTLLHIPPSSTAMFSVADPSQVSITFSAANGPILTITPEGRLERGTGMSDDEASVRFFDVLSKSLPCWIMELRQRAEKAEAELAALKATGG